MQSDYAIRNIVWLIGVPIIAALYSGTSRAGFARFAFWTRNCGRKKPHKMPGAGRRWTRTQTWRG